MKEKREHNNMEITFWNYPENEKISRILAAAFITELDPTIEEMSDIKTAVSEAVTNAIIHAYPGKKGKVTMNLERKGSEIIISISDEGVGIKDIKKAMEPMYTTVKDEERSGMGFTFMEAFTDKLDVISICGIGTRVVLTRKIGGAGGSNQ